MATQPVTTKPERVANVWANGKGKLVWHCPEPNCNATIKPVDHSINSHYSSKHKKDSAYQKNAAKNCPIPCSFPGCTKTGIDSYFNYESHFRRVHGNNEGLQAQYFEEVKIHKARLEEEEETKKKQDEYSEHARKLRVECWKEGNPVKCWDCEKDGIKFLVDLLEHYHNDHGDLEDVDLHSQWEFMQDL